jgi:hypothetical protein
LPKKLVAMLVSAPIRKRHRVIMAFSSSVLWELRPIIIIFAVRSFVQAAKADYSGRSSSIQQIAFRGSLLMQCDSIHG